MPKKDIKFPDREVNNVCIFAISIRRRHCHLSASSQNVSEIFYQPSKRDLASW